MKALLSEQIGPAATLQLREIAIPTPKANEVLIKLRATGINYRDSLIIEDNYQFKAERPFAPCGEIAGEIVEKGALVNDFKIGDRVFGDLTWGGLAEYICVPVDNLAIIPDGLDFETAAASIITYGTSLYALKQKGRLKAGEKVLILGASGGVGIAALQIARAMGALVYAAISSEEKANIALQNGAHHAIIYPKGPFDEGGKMQLKKIFKDACGDGGFDVIYDAVGGDYSEASLRAIAWNGRFLVVGFPSGIPKIPLNLTLVKGCEISGIFFSEFASREVEAYNANLNQLAEFLTTGQIKPLISARFPLNKGIDAILALKNRNATGKLLVINDL